MRARSENDIRNLSDLIDAKPERGGGTDYRWRLRCPKTEWASAVSTMANEIDYANFKSRIGRDDPHRAHILSQVWDVLLQIQREDL